MKYKKTKKSKIGLSSGLENFLAIFFLALLVLATVSLTSSVLDMELPWFQTSDGTSSDGANTPGDDTSTPGEGAYEPTWEEDMGDTPLIEIELDEAVFITYYYSYIL
ncbi:MAG: hypothetical protein IJY23_01070 [Clostridia bacterium]|nr:hypothetical protein [Clostridia bacterium]